MNEIVLLKIITILSIYWINFWSLLIDFFRIVMKHYAVTEIRLHLLHAFYLGLWQNIRNHITLFHKFKSVRQTTLDTYSDGTIWPWGKRWLRYDTAQNIAIRYDTIWYNTVPKRCTVCQQSKINVAFSLTPSHALASCLTTPSTVVDDIWPLSIISGRVWTWGRYGTVSKI